MKPFQVVAALPFTAYFFLFWVPNRWRHRRCIGGILVALPAAACLCYFKCLFNGATVAACGILVAFFAAVCVIPGAVTP